MEATLVNFGLSNKRYEAILPISTLYLATVLDKEGYKVNIIDEQIEDPKSKLEKVVNRSQFVGFSVMTTNVKKALVLSDFIKEIDPEIPVIWGGTHPTLYPEQTADDPSVDFVVKGEGELTLLEFTKYLKGERSLEDVEGLVYKKNGKIKLNPPPPYIDLNTLSPPNWDLLNMSYYIHDRCIGDESYGRSTRILTGKGCAHRCSFCINAMGRRKWRPLDAVKIVNEIQLMKEKFNVDSFNFLDENFFINKKRIEKFYDIMKAEKIDITWDTSCRASYFNQNHVNDDILKKIKEIGCIAIGMGIESGSQRMLDLLKKDTTVEQITHAIKKLTEFDIHPICSTMIGVPHEKSEDVFATISLIKEITQINPNARIFIPQLFRPYPGGTLYNEIVKMFEEPKNLRMWADSSLIDGYLPTKNFPWIDDQQLVETVIFCYSNKYRQKLQKNWKYLPQILMKKTSTYRIAHNNFKYPLEQRIYEYFQSIV